MYRSTKTYGHELGLSACFRQHKADSHCRYLHGYALAFTFTFESPELDVRNWVVDFGGLRDLRTQLQEQFDHTLLVAMDDPHGRTLEQLQQHGLVDLRIVDAVGCEAFAVMGAAMAHRVLVAHNVANRVRVYSCEVREHGANSAIFLPPVGFYDAPVTARKFLGSGNHE